jgi:16S rRNA (adenine1518-N6/adenine1519-N6)-dimethyltransferase
MAHKPRKRFGQNFLHDPVYQRRIADSIQLREGAKCVEIGPGKGAITAHLLRRFSKLDAIEMDRDLVVLLNRKFSHTGLCLHQGDALKVDFKALAGQQRLSIIGNLPYNISSPLLFQLIENLDVIDEMVFMLQKEVVDRMTATPGNKTYGRLSVTTGLLLHSEKLFDVPPGAFFPAPKVISSVVRLRPRTDVDQSIDRRIFDGIVKAAFAQRRKTIRNALSKWASEDELIDLCVDPKQRAEQLDIKTYAHLARNLSDPDRPA